MQALLIVYHAFFHESVAEAMPATMQFGKIDAYCIFSYNGSNQHSQTKPSNYDPVYNVSMAVYHFECL